MPNRFASLLCAGIVLTGFSLTHGQSTADPAIDPAQRSSPGTCTSAACSDATDVPGNQQTDASSQRSTGQAGQAAQSEANGSGRSDGANSSRSRTVAGSTDGLSDVQNVRRPPAVQAPPAEPTAFEKYVQDSTGHSLRVFGSEYFSAAPADFLSPQNVAATADYVLGTGDQVRVQTSGSIVLDERLTVDRNGLIFIPQVGSLAVAGLQLSEAENHIRREIAKQYRNFDLTVALGQLRSIQVFVLGEARQPGVHTISSLSTLVNGIFAAGGPAPTGSYRDIQLKRGSRVVEHLDLYDLLLKGDKRADARLQAGDIIFIPFVGAQAAIDGDVNKPAIYELRDNTTVADLLQYSGGLTPIAATDRASIDRIVDHARRTVQDFPLTGAQSLIPLQAGDLLRIFPISPRFDQAVTLRGNVGQPGRYPWRSGMRVSDLIPSREFLITRLYYNRQNALTPPLAGRPFSASSPENGGRPDDRVSAVSQDTAAAAATAAQAVTTTTTNELGNHETEINWNYAVIERLDSKNLKTSLIPFVLGEAIDSPASAENRQLEPGDVITVYSRNDINLPSELRARFVRIDGEVVRPGVYRIEGDETLRDLLARAGGIAPHGYLYAAQLTRESVRIADEAKLQLLLAQIGRDALSPANQGVLSTGAPTASDLDLRRAYLAALAQMHATGRITLQISPATTAAADLPPIPLQDGDRFFIPPQPTTVDVLGNVFNAGAQLYSKGNSVGYYLKLAGSKTRSGDKGQQYLLRADGTVLSRSTHARFDRLLVNPGDTIIVPPKLKPGFNLFQVIGLSQTLSSVALTALAIGVLR